MRGGEQERPVDLLIVGGGLDGAAIIRDATGRRLSVLLLEQHDLAHHISSASTKLIHGGPRSPGYYEFRLAREALIECERLLGTTPHIAWRSASFAKHSAGSMPISPGPRQERYPQ